jgi:hypothetical protein
MLSTHLLTDRKAFNLVLLVFQSSIVGLSISVPTKLNGVLAEATHLVAVVGLVILSPREHCRSVSPSSSLVVYLSIRTFLNVSALLLGYNRSFTTIQALRIIIEAGNLIVESQNKKHFLLEPFLGVAPEETAGPWSKASFAWVGSILFAEKDITFSLETLPPNPRRFDPSDLRRNILLAWDQRGKPISRIQRIDLKNPYSEARRPSDIAIDLGTMSHARICYCCTHEIHAHRVSLRPTTSHEQDIADAGHERFGWAIVPALMHHSHHLDGSLHWTSCTKDQPQSLTSRTNAHADCFFKISASAQPSQNHD